MARVVVNLSQQQKDREYSGVDKNESATKENMNTFLVLKLVRDMMTDPMDLSSQE